MLCEAVPFSKPPGRVPVLCGRGTGTAVVPLRPAVLPRTAQRDKWLDGDGETVGMGYLVDHQ